MKDIAASARTGSYEVDLRPLFRPASVAIVGASERTPYSVNAFKNLRSLDYAGPIYPINPKHSSILGLKCYPTINDTPSPPELAVIVVNRDAVLDIVAECASAGVKAVVVNANGFADDSGPRGLALQAELADAATQSDLLLCGPNCLGVINLRAGVAPFCGPADLAGATRGNISIISQSGGNTAWLMQAASERNIGIAYAISGGNEAGLDICDYLEYLLDEGSTSAFCLFLETIRRPRRFLELATRAAVMSTPIIAVKVGKSSAAQRAALAHTGAFAGQDRFVEALFQRAGVLRADDLDNAMDKCVLFGSLPARLWPKGRRLAVFTIGGGLASLTSDASSARGMELPSLSEPLASDLRCALPSNLTIQNPLDVLAGDAGAYDRNGAPPSLTEMFVVGCAKDDHFDAIVIAANLPDPRISTAFLKMLESAVENCGKPIVLCRPIAQTIPEAWRQYLGDSRLAMVAGIDRCSVALEAVAAFRQGMPRRRKAPKRAAKLSDIVRSRLLAEVAAGKGIASHAVTYALLDSYGLPVVRQSVVSSPQEGVSIAESIGFPVVVKALNTEALAHKTEAGAVRVNLRSASEVAQAVSDVSAISGRAPRESSDDSVVVQKMLSGGVEMYFGAATANAGYPPAVFVGFGGVGIEAIGDVVMAITPVDRVEVDQMLQRLRGYSLLTGFRGQPPLAISAVATGIVRLSELVQDLESVIAEIDINPAIVFEKGRGMRIVDALVAYRRSD
jgi:acetate---CoA ligase (ADP-forming)